MSALPGGLPDVARSVPLPGGDVAEVVRAELVDGRTVVVKRTPYDAGLEAEGLEALGAAGVRVPRVLGVAPDVLVLEHVTARPDLEALGAELASAHGQLGDAFGWRRDNVIGPLPQANPATDRWSELYVEHRLLPYADDLPAELAARLRRACEGPLPGLLEHGQPPSLVHGDLWAGNILDQRVLIDPAVHHADRELDLAMLDLFGGVPEPFAAGYEAVWPLDDGWSRRRPALQLYHLLVHVRLFGAGYHAGVARRLERLGC
jgi:fructosamine-3-kinase